MSRWGCWLPRFTFGKQKKEKQRSLGWLGGPCRHGVLAARMSSLRHPFKQLLMVGKRREGKVRSAAPHRASGAFLGAALGFCSFIPHTAEASPASRGPLCPQPQGWSPSRCGTELPAQPCLCAELSTSSSLENSPAEGQDPGKGSAPAREQHRSFLPQGTGQGAKGNLLCQTSLFRCSDDGTERTGLSHFLLEETCYSK